MSPFLPLLASTFLAAAPPQGASLQRFGLFIGSNDGGPGRTTLRYAGSDARAVARVLEQLGGVSPADASLLLDPSRAQFDAELTRLGAAVERARRAGARTELVVYFSGHADENGLLLGRERIDYPALRAEVERVPADVRVAILDSCHAGAIIRTKGGKRVPAFLVDTSTVVRGQAFLTASSANEAAQESDRIKGSYFTSSLLTGLRGAADTTQDGKVTLTEAYQFAFQETLAKTERSSAGPQHPAYDFALAGTGDLVMTDVRAVSAGLLVAPEVAGRLFVRDGGGQLIAELRKLAGHPMELGLEPGRYEITLEAAEGVFQARADLTEGARFGLGLAQFARAEVESAARRGPEATAAAQRPTLLANLSFVPGISVASVMSEPPLSFFAFNLVAGRLGALHGFELGTALNLENEEMRGLQIAGVANHVGGEVRGLQIGGAYNHGGSLTGLQIGGAANLISGEARGLQIGGAVNVAEKLAGLQIASVNVAEGATAQVGAFNTATESRLQIGAINVGSGSRLQLGGINVGEDVPAQIAGINWATRNGLQIGGVNIAEENRFSLGAINIAKSSKAPVGVINLVRDGYHAVSVWGSDLTGLTLGLKLGGERTYSVFGFGTRPGDQRFATWAAWGVHLTSDKWFLDTDLGASNYYDARWVQKQAVAATLRLVVGRQLWSSLSVVAGPTLNVVTTWDGRDLDLAVLPQTVWHSGETTVRLFPGFVLGVQI